MRPGAFLLLLLQCAAVVLVTAASLPPPVSLSQVPKCSLPCLLAVVQESDCPADDTACICADKKGHATFRNCIMVSTCKPKEQLLAAQYALQRCNTVPLDRGDWLVVLNYGGLAVTFGIVALRLSTKTFAWGGVAGAMSLLGWDDVFIVLAWLAEIPMSVIQGDFMTALGLGQEGWSLTGAETETLTMWSVIIGPLYTLQMTLTRASFVFMYLRIFTSHGQQGRRTLRHRWLGLPNGLDLSLAFYGTLVVNGLVCIAYIGISLGQCHPYSYTWTAWTGETQGWCPLDRNAVAWTNGICGTCIDLWLLYLPLSQIPSMALSHKKKGDVIAMLCLATCFTVFGGLRMHAVILLGVNPDEYWVWKLWDVCLWGATELLVGIVCACVPALRIVFLRNVPRLASRLLKRPGATAKYDSEGGSRATTKSTSVGISQQSRSCQRSNDDGLKSGGRRSSIEMESMPDGDVDLERAGPLSYNTTKPLKPLE